MAIPYQVADTIGFLAITCDGQKHNLVEASDVSESVTDIHLRSDPSNGVASATDATKNLRGNVLADPQDPKTWIYVGNATNPSYPLKPDQSLNLRVSRRSGLSYIGPQGHILHVVTAQVSKSIPPGATS